MRSRLLREISELRILDRLESALLAVAMGSVGGIIVALMLNAPGTAWKFLYSLMGSGVTMILVGLYRARRYG